MIEFDSILLNLIQTHFMKNCDPTKGLKELQEFNLSNNQLSVLNKKFLKGAYNLKERFPNSSINFSLNDLPNIGKFF